MAIEATIAITGMNAKPDNPGPGLAVARCLKESPEFNGRIVGLGYDALDPGLYLKDFCDATYLLPYPSAGDQALLDTLAYITAKESIDLLLPCLDAELPSMIRLQPAIKQMGIQLFVPEQEQLRMRNKDQLDELARVAKISTPETKAITSPAFFYQCEEEGWSYPLLVKGIFYDARIAKTAAEASEAFHSIAAIWGYPILAQKLVKGEEYNLTGVGDGHGRLLGEVMMKKMAITDKGKAWAGVSILDKTLREASVALVEKLNWRGPLEVEVIRDRQGEYQLIEINPRFPAWIYLSYGVGRNLPLLLLKLAFGLPPGELEAAKAGIMFVRYAQEQITTIGDFEALVMANYLPV